MRGAEREARDPHRRLERGAYPVHAGRLRLAARP